MPRQTRLTGSRAGRGGRGATRRAAPRTSDRATARLIRAHMSATYQRIYDVVVRIPRGRVMTYGQVAEAAGLPRAARIVGYAMHAIGEHVPWQRVLGQRRPGVAHVTIKDALGGARQRQLLEQEGVAFSASGGVSLEDHGWGPQRKARARRR